MGKSTISKQAKSYAEVIVGQIADNFTALNLAVKNCDDFEDAQKEYDALDVEGTDELTLKTAKDKMGIIQNTIGSSFCSDKTSAIEPLAVGLFGEWGSGKTHQLKLIQERIKRIQRKEYTPKDSESTFPKEITVIPIFFNAWRFEKEEHIILPLFQTLLDALENYERTLTEKGKRALKPLLYHMKNVLFSMHKGIDPLSIIKTVKGVVTGDVEELAEVENIVDVEVILNAGEEATNAEQVNNQSLTQLLKPDPLQSIYLNIPQWIEKITLFENVNFVFLIDDLDRCLPENTLKMLESMKLFLDVPSCAFVLAVDDDVVERGVVHHYRDYLQQNSNTIIYMGKEDVSSESGKSKTQELPITGHEYLEKMIQLPLRLPVIDTANVREFLEECSARWIEIVDSEYEEKIEAWESFNENLKTLGDTRRTQAHYTMKPNKYSDNILDFFSKSVPTKPRKIKRTAKLFEMKLRLLEMRGLLEKVDYMFVAKLTLLELFAPKLLRFIQNQGYGLIFNTLCHFREASYQFHMQSELEEELQGKQQGETIDKYLNSLADKTIIEDYINRPSGIDDNGYTTKEKNIFLRAMRIVDEHFLSRVAFDLDIIFDKVHDTEKLKLILELQENKQHKSFSTQTSYFTDEFYIRLFRGGDVDAWKDGLREHDTMIDRAQLDELIDKAMQHKDSSFNNLPFLANPEWVGIVANYVTDEDYIILLMASHNVRFKTDDMFTFEIDCFQMTFSEYDKYCEIVGIDKLNDTGWGRGRRPVINVSWNDAIAYMEWLNKKFEDINYGLPTEKEWKQTCNYKSEKDAIWHFGEDESKLKEYAWYRYNSGQKTHKVGELIPNKLECFDMHGNIWEWCKDWYDKFANTKSLKGGSWIDNAYNIHASASIRYLPANSIDSCVGFRLCRTLR